MKIQWLSICFLVILTGCAAKNEDADLGLEQPGQQKDILMNVHDTERVSRAEEGRNQHASQALQTSEDITNRLEGMKEVKRAEVILSGKQVYVAAVLNRGKHLTKELEGKMAAAVQSGDLSVRDVYISTNPSFVHRMDSFVNEMRGGQSVKELENDFHEVVKMVFPDSK
ncbi:YhcN/YlaJ family sporulation lipoprotein [Bacillus massiliglaciei]|uniref:YhcN/YlaJ family sporulation lipoprotein n=1 Tax=Bacillus massiliglaciei TaxID=1816693 RepID=UPI000DA609F3|nr:YhcN/YlaJ family sporulation lipoprotein [Bacillus massiliglaciei]